MAARTADVLLQALGVAPSSAPIAALLDNLSSASAEQPPPTLTQQVLGPVAYHTAAPYGISLQFERARGGEEWTCQAVDLYNDGYDATFQSFPALPFTLITRNGNTSDEDTRSFALSANTTGTQLVSAFGEPSRKGGGELLKGGGASGLGPGAWMEWRLIMPLDGQDDISIDLMVELMGAAVRTHDRWSKDKGGAARWGVCTLSLVA